MAKMAVLEEALHVMSIVHAQVEKMGVAIKNKQPTTVFVQGIKRQLTPLTTKLKMQFGMIADQLAAMLLASTRGASEQVRLRTMREHVAQVKVALEIAVAQTILKHAAHEGTPPKGVEAAKPPAPRPSQAVPRPSQAVPLPPESASRSSQAAIRPSQVAPQPTGTDPVPPLVPLEAAAAAPTAAAPARATAAGRAFNELPEEAPRRSTLVEELDEHGNPIVRRTTASAPPPDTSTS